VVANGAEGEPASIKDRLLLGRVPHLVLDGASLAAAAVGATRLIVYVRPSQFGAVSAAVADRAHLGLDSVEPEVVIAADGFVAGEASAVVANVNGGPGAVPTFTRLRPVHERGVGGRPTLVQNVETLAHVALIARFGAAWFRQLGTADTPGTALATVSGTGRRPGVVEMPVGTTLRSLIARFAVRPSSLQAVLLGGYGGAWVSARQVMDVPLCEERLRPLGATLGAGVVALLPKRTCPLAETARIVRYMAGQTAGQCGPCVNGLPAMTEAMTNLAFDHSRMRGAHDRLIGLCDLIDGRGACHHPDGVARLVRSALRTFAIHLDLHRRRGPCPAAYRPGVLTIPDPDPRGPVARPYSA
jgi:NADH:ubiquinone oxidoreductase subunit F (NADH-binding)